MCYDSCEYGLGKVTVKYYNAAVEAVLAAYMQLCPAI